MTRKPSSKSNTPHKCFGELKPVKMSEFQQLVLVRGSQTKDGYLLERPNGRVAVGKMPESGFGSAVRDQRTIAALLRRGLIEGAADKLFDLKLTALAFVSLHIDESEWPKRLRPRRTHNQPRSRSNRSGVADHAARKENPTASPSPSAISIKPGSKGDTVLKLISASEGASLADLKQATGWQGHSVRGFISGTLRKKHGVEIACQLSNDGTRIYRKVGQV